MQSQLTEKAARLSRTSPATPALRCAGALRPRARVTQRCGAAPAPFRAADAPAASRLALVRAAAAAGNSAEAGTAVQAGLRELTQNDFWDFLESHSDKLTVVDFFTDWCGPCKMIYPELVKMNEELKERGGQVVKFNCNKNNKDLGKELGIKVAPTFHLYRGRTKLGEMTGAKVDRLKELIEQNL